MPVLDEAGNYTDRLTIPFGVDNVLITVVPPPPDDWSLAGSLDIAEAQS